MQEYFKKEPSTRQLKVARQLQSHISDIIAKSEFYEISADLVKISINAVSISPDLKNAIIYYESLGNISADEKISLTQYLNSHVSRLNYLVSSKVRLKYMPVLRFKYDDIATSSRRITELLGDK